MCRAGGCDLRLWLLAPAVPSFEAGKESCARGVDGLAARPSVERKNDAVRTLRQALGYCWSVAVAADPDTGLRRFETLAAYDDADVAWIARENAKKSRLAKLL